MKCILYTTRTDILASDKRLEAAMHCYGQRWSNRNQIERDFKKPVGSSTYVQLL
jgi:hypothetical protein